MQDDFLRCNEQLRWEPKVANPEKLGSYTRFVVLGMGGSNLGPWLLKHYAPAPDIYMHRDYGLPAFSDWSDTLVIASSYSGNTEETIDGANEALRQGRPLAVIAKGGMLLALAKDKDLPYIEIPDTGIQPRVAVGYSTVGIAKLMGKEDAVRALQELGATFDPAARRSEAEAFGEKLRGSIPVVYASTANLPLAYVWKINFNENAKIPAFANSIPELCHNELNGFGVVEETKPLSARMHVIMLVDGTDHPRVEKRMRIMQEMLAEKGIAASSVALKGSGFAKAFDAVLFASWLSLSLAGFSGVPAEEVPMVEDFKKRMA